jgi:hypothetical protein
VRHYLQERIDAHFLTCFISLLIARLLQKTLDKKYSINQISNALKQLVVDQQTNLVSLIHWPLEEIQRTIIRDLCTQHNIYLEYNSITTKKLLESRKKIIN